LIYILYPASSLLIYKLRLTRVIFVFLVGSGISIISFILQSLTRTPLASEYTLGISSGVAFFASIAYILDLNPLFFSIIGGISITTLLVIFIRKRLGSNSFVLIGISLSIFFGSGISFINYITSFKSSQVLSRWIFGSFSFYSWCEIITLIIMYIFLIISFYFYLPKIILISISPVYEEILGKNFKTQITFMVFIIGIFISFLSTFVGPVPFFGLVVSNIIRIIFKSNMIYTFFSLIASGSVLVLLDFISKNLLIFEELPIGILTGIVCLPLVLVSIKKSFY